MKGYFDTIPKELDESAKIDGAGHMRIFLQIMLPLAKPILAVVALFNFMGPFMDFILPKILLRSPEKFTLAVGLFNFINDKYANNFTVFAVGGNYDCSTYSNRILVLATLFSIRFNNRCDKRLV